MSKNFYIGNGNIAREGQDIYVGINGVARKVKSGYVGVNGVARKFWPSVVYYYWNVYNINYTQTITRESNITIPFSSSPISVYTWRDYEIINGRYDLTNAKRTGNGLSNQSGYHRTDGGFIVGSWRNDTGYSSPTGWYWENYTLSQTSGSWVYILYCDKYDLVAKQGSYVRRVTSTNQNAYSQNGVQGDYWYVYQGTQE